MKKILIDTSEVNAKRTKVPLRKTDSDFNKRDLKIRNKDTKKKSIFRFRNIFIVFVLILLITGGVYFQNIYASLNKAVNANLLSFISNEVTGNQIKLNETNGKTTTLIVGVDSREGAISSDLKGVGNTDTIMLAVYDNATSNVEFVSIPRDVE